MVASVYITSPKPDASSLCQRRLLVERENHLGLTREQLAKLDNYCAAERDHCALRPFANLQNGHRWCWGPLNDLMAVYVAHRQTITAALADGKALEPLC
jgi:hypothetical protein